jgi:hypothetical protein
MIMMIMNHECKKSTACGGDWWEREKLMGVKMMNIYREREKERDRGRERAILSSIS